MNSVKASKIFFFNFHFLTQLCMQHTQPHHTKMRSTSFYKYFMFKFNCFRVKFPRLFIFYFAYLIYSLSSRDCVIAAFTPIIHTFFLHFAGAVHPQLFWNAFFTQQFYKPHFIFQPKYTTIVYCFWCATKVKGKLKY